MISATTSTTKPLRLLSTSRSFSLDRIEISRHAVTHNNNNINNSNINNIYINNINNNISKTPQGPG